MRNKIPGKSGPPSFIHFDFIQVNEGINVLIGGVYKINCNASFSPFGHYKNIQFPPERKVLNGRAWADNVELDPRNDPHAYLARMQLVKKFITGDEKLKAASTVYITSEDDVLKRMLSSRQSANFDANEMLESLFKKYELSLLFENYSDRLDQSNRYDQIVGKTDRKMSRHANGFLKPSDGAKGFFRAHTPFT